MPLSHPSARVVYRGRGYAKRAAALAIAIAISTPAWGQTSGTWSQSGTATPYSWSTAGNWTAGNVADGIGATATFATPGLSATQIISLDSDRTVGTLVFGNPTNAFGWQLTGPSGLTLGVAAGTPTIAVNNPNLTATIAAPIAGTQGFTKTGTGTLLLGGLNSITGPVTVSSGTLGLDFAVTTTDVLPNSTPVTLASGGGLLLTAPATAVASQSVASLAINSGAATITAQLGTGATSSLSMGTITRASGGTLTFVNPATGASYSAINSNGAGGILGGWAIVTSPAAGTYSYATSAGDGTSVPGAV